MGNILCDLKISCVLIYLNVITVFSHTFYEHLTYLLLLFSRLREDGLKLNPLKFSLFKNKADFLGRKVLQAGIASPLDKFSCHLQNFNPFSLRYKAVLGMVAKIGNFSSHYRIFQAISRAPR